MKETLQIASIGGQSGATSTSIKYRKVLMMLKHNVRLGFSATDSGRLPCEAYIETTAL